jgi:hypothetical protein
VEVFSLPHTQKKTRNGWTLVRDSYVEWHQEDVLLEGFGILG